MPDSLIIFVAKYVYVVSVALFIGYGLFTKRRTEFLLFALLVLPVSFLLSVLAGHLFYDPRPFVSEGLTPLISHAADNGFPSDHALLTGTLAAIATPFSFSVGALLWVLAILVGSARVLAHVHHTLDIVGSYAIAAVSAVAMYPLLRKLRDPFARAIGRLGIRAR